LSTAREAAGPPAASFSQQLLLGLVGCDRGRSDRAGGIDVGTPVLRVARSAARCPA